MVVRFLFKKFINFFFIVMTVIVKGLSHFFSSIAFLFSTKAPQFPQWFSSHIECPVLFQKTFFHLFECGNHIKFDCFFTLSHGYIYDTWFKMKFRYESIIYIEYIFLSSLSKRRYALKPLLSSFRNFWKKKKNIACFNISLVINFILRSFVVGHIIIVTTSSSVSFFRSFPCFVWNFYCQ